MPKHAASAEQISDALDGLKIEPSTKGVVLKQIVFDTTGLLLYGSRARGDFLPSSDYDILRLSATSLSTFSSRRVSVSSYTPDQLRSASNTLFGTHVKRDGKIFLDPFGELAEIVSTLEPADPIGLIRTVRTYSIVLNQPHQERDRHIAGITRLARYLLRTAIYARAMLDERPCFSVRELAVRFDDPALSTLLASNPEITGPPNRQTLHELLSRLAAEIGPLPDNEFQTLDTLAVAMWDVDRNISALAIRAASEDGDELDYSDLPKVLL